MLPTLMEFLIVYTMHALLPPSFNRTVEQGIHLGVLYCSGSFLVYNVNFPSSQSQFWAPGYFKIPKCFHLPYGSLIEKM